jgi:hypothetical protein
MLRRIEIATAAGYLRRAPKFNRAQLESLKNAPEEIARWQRSMIEHLDAVR